MFEALLSEEDAVISDELNHASIIDGELVAPPACCGVLYACVVHLCLSVFIQCGMCVLLPSRVSLRRVFFVGLESPYLYGLLHTGIRLCKAQRKRYKHLDLADLEAQLVASQGCRLRLIVTDGVFSMDGDVAPLKEICDLADK